MLIPVATIIGLIAVFAVLWSTSLLVPVRSGGSQSMAPTLPACNGRYVGEGFTYRFRDPHRGEVVLIHARGELGGPITPEPKGRDLNLTKRVIGIPGDTVVGRGDRVFVNGSKADDIPTTAFPPTHLGASQYFVLGDSRSFSQDSRDFGPIPRGANLRPRLPHLLAFEPIRHARPRQTSRTAWARVPTMTNARVWTQV